MILVNTEYIPGMTIVRICGLVQGNTVRAKHIGRDMMAALKNVVGGELVGYTELLQESRHEAISRMLYDAEQLGANAVLNVRFCTSSIAAGAAEIYCYGTAAVVASEAAAAPAAPAVIPAPAPATPPAAISAPTPSSEATPPPTETTP